MNVRSIRFKIGFWSGVSLAVLGAIITVVAVGALERMVADQREATLSASKRLMLFAAEGVAADVEGKIEQALDTARTLTQVFASLADSGEPRVPEDEGAPSLEEGMTDRATETLPSDGARGAKGRLDREVANQVLRTVLERNPDFLGVYTAWEPNAFDGRDASYVDRPGTDATGRFIPYWSRSQDGELMLEPLLDYETPGAGDYYLVPKSTRAEQAIDPYLYPVQGREMLLTSLVVPIVLNDRFRGIAGVDMALERLQQTVEQAAEGQYDGHARVVLVAHDGTIVAASDQPELIGKPLSAMHEDWEEDLATVQAGQPVTEEDEGNLMAVAPIRLGATDSPWGIQFIVPIDYVMGPVERSVADGRRTIWIMIGVSVLCVVLGVAILLFVAGAVARPIRRLSSTLREIAEGDGDLTRRLDDSGRDELAELAGAFNGFQAKLRELIRELALGSDQVSASAEQLSATSRATEEHIKRQHSETDQVATAMNEMSATVNEVARHANEAASATQQADQQADAGRTAVARSVEAMRALSDQVESATQVIGRVSNDASEINKILDVIGGIADQTNLLALNAAIEAARAGEQGRGFAVVADEVRNLARRTQDSTREIQEMIERLQLGAGQAVTEMGSGRAQAQDSMALVAEAAGSIDIMVGSVATIKDMNMQIASASEEQAAVAEEIDRNLSNISQVVDEIAAGSSQASDAAEALKRLAAEQRQRVGRFKV